MSTTVWKEPVTFRREGPVERYPLLAVIVAREALGHK